MAVELAENPQLRSPELHIFDAPLRAYEAMQQRVESRGTFAPHTISVEGKSYVGALTPTVKAIQEDAKLLTQQRETEKVESIPESQIQEEVKAEMDEIRGKLTGLSGEKLKQELDIYLPQVFSQFGQAVKETVGYQEIHDFQLKTAIAMHDGKVAELPTGRGKTVAIGHAAALNALAGKGVHVITANDYLARRDASLLGEAYHKLGLSVAVIISRDTVEEETQYIYDPTEPGDDPDFPHLVKLEPGQRKAAYDADITYGINHSFMTDTLIDQKPENLLTGNTMQRHYVAFVDEADDIMADEAEIPHILGKFETLTDKQKDTLITCQKIAEKLQLARLDDAGHLTNWSSADLTIETDESMLEARFLPTEQGAENIWKLLEKSHLVEPSENSSYDDLFDGTHNDLLLALDNAYRAQYAFIRDVDYIVDAAGEIKLISAPKGRRLISNRLSHGLHQALEAKEDVEIKPDMITENEISVPEYFTYYTRLGATTGTATEAADIFYRLYGMDVVEILPPTNSHLIHEKTTGILRGKEGPNGSFAKAVQSALRKHATGQPVIIFAQSIEDADIMGEMLKESLPFDDKQQVNILHAKQDADEARIIAEAGKYGAITVTTQMAGRGTDIIPGGELEIPSFTRWIATRPPGSLRLNGTREEYNTAVRGIVAEHALQQIKVNELGGPHCILFGDRFKRLMRQKRGRTGRQNGPGSYEVILSWKDALFAGMKLEQRTRNHLLTEYGLTLPEFPKTPTQDELGKILKDKGQDGLNAFIEKFNSDSKAIKQKRAEMQNDPRYQAKVDALIASLQQKEAAQQTDSLVGLAERQNIVAQVRQRYLSNLEQISDPQQLRLFVESAIRDVIDMLIENPYQGQPIETAENPAVSQEAPSKEDFALTAIESMFDLNLENDELSQLIHMSDTHMRQELFELAKQQVAGLFLPAVAGFARTEIMRAWQQFLVDMPFEYTITIPAGFQSGTFSTRLRLNTQGLLQEIERDMKYHFIQTLFTPVTVQPMPAQESLIPDAPIPPIPFKPSPDTQKPTYMIMSPGLPLGMQPFFTKEDTEE